MRSVSKDRLLRGIVLREASFGEADKYLTILTGELGKISVVAKGARSYRSPYMQASQLFCCADFLLCEKKERYSLVEAVTVDTFYRLREDFVQLSLGQYFLDVVSEVCSENDPTGAENVLRLLLNCLYALANGLYPQHQIKAAFEFRLAAIEGFMPELGGCARCGKNKRGDQLYLDVMNGALVCSDCLRAADNLPGVPVDGDSERTASILCPLTEETLGALRYIISSRPERLLSFSLTEEGLSELEKTAEVYLLNQLDRGFETLKFYKQAELMQKKSAGKEATDNIKNDTAEEQTGI